MVYKFFVFQTFSHYYYFVTLILFFFFFSLITTVIIAQVQTTRFETVTYFILNSLHPFFFFFCYYFCFYLSFTTILVFGPTEPRFTVNYNNSNRQPCKHFGQKYEEEVRRRVTIGKVPNDSPGRWLRAVTARFPR